MFLENKKYVFQIFTQIKLKNSVIQMQLDVGADLFEVFT